MGIRGGGRREAQPDSQKPANPTGLSFRTGEAGEESAFAYQEHRRAQRYRLPLRKAPRFGARFLSHARAEDRKLRKELAFGGPCLEGTLQKPTGCFRIKPRGRGD